ncbi:keratin, type I cytoskeletal 9 isoform X2 [Drosophila biarmipes]|uniref:keratin, type I cytoskeletal 9 isoform X2 n=1 Tax=Drosophila biarmipes TaxID=125945 RepID=UPI0007E7C521|nr:keratin, type I cytoskeletal 9 isoform X2 [Drosophila biarmipes]
MWKILIICVVMSALNQESSGANSRSSRRRRAYAGGYAGGFASSGGGAGGYTGSYNSGGGGVGHSSYAGTGYGGGAGYYDYDDYGGSSPNFGIIDPYLFHQQLTNHILAQNYANQHRIQQQIAAQQAYHDNLVRQNRYRGGSSSASGSASSSGSGSGSGYGSYNSHRYAPSFASASGSIGPNGFRQTAFINPPNPASPNIVNRFGGGSGGGSSFSSSSSSGGGSGGGGGYKGVSVSSYSHSNGDGTSRRGAQTTVNDNGKVTSYSVHS